MMQRVTALLPDDLPAAEVLRQRPPTLDEITSVCADYYNVSSDRLAMGRDRQTSHTRRCIYYFARRYIRMMSCKQISTRFFKRTENSVWSGASKVEGMREHDELIRDDLDILERRIAQAVLNWRFTPCR